MSFADVSSPKFSGRKTAFLPLTQGYRVIRLLDKGATRFHTHWLNGATIKCLGKECPICETNKKIIADNPDTYRNVKGYNGYRKTFYVNVFDKTPVKKDVESGKEYYPDLAGNFPAVTDEGKSLQAVKASPSNTVKVLSRGVELFDQFNSYENVFKDEEGNVLSLNEFDFRLNIPNNKRPVVMPEPMGRDPVDLGEQEVYELESVLVTLDPDEIKELVRGVKLRDIFAARRLSESSEEEDVAEDIEYEVVDDSIEDLLNEVDI